MSHSRLAWLALSVLVGCSLLAQESGPVVPAPSSTAAAPLRVGILGASVSDGFGCRLHEQRTDGDYEATFRLATMVQLICGERAVTIDDRATNRMFFDPKKHGGDAAAAVRKAAPQCVIALDYLFWYCYGSHGAKGEPAQVEAARLAVFEQGLAELAKFDVPIVVGDIPDMSRAVGKMLAASQMPSLDSIAAANARLAEWTKQHPNVRVVPLSKIIRQLHEDQAVEVAGKRFAATAEQPLLQRDQLHATPAGLAAIACVLVNVLAEADAKLGLPRTDDPAAVLLRAKERLVKKEPPAAKPKPADSGK